MGMMEKKLAATIGFSVQGLWSKLIKAGDLIWQFPKIGGPQYRPQKTIILTIGRPKWYPNFGKFPYRD